VDVISSWPSSDPEPFNPSGQTNSRFTEIKSERTNA
jgi:hypothetical protein